MPLSVFPTPFPAELLAESLKLQPSVGKVVAGLVRDPEHNMWQVLEEISKHDEFVVKLVKVSQAFAKRKASGLSVQDIHMCVLRSDYMIDWPSD